MDRRKFLKLMGGIAALPAVGSLGSGAKKAKKGIVAAGQAAKMTPTQSILPDVVATVMKKGKEFDTGMPNSVGKKYKGVEVVEDSGEVYVSFETDRGNKAFARIEKADYVVDETTGKSKYKPPEYDEGQEIMKGPDDVDVEYEILDNVSGLRSIAMEGKVSEQVKDIAGRLKKREGFAFGGLGGLGRVGKAVKLDENQGMIKKPEPTKKPLTKKLREPIINQLRSANVISENDISRILEEYGILSLAEGGVASGPPPEKGPNSQGLESLFQTR